MEDEIEVFSVEPFLGEEEIDLDYEFDAPRFYDFSQPENYWDVAEAEQWFESAGSYPPSPFVLKLRWGNATPSKLVYTSADCRDGNSLNVLDDNSSRCMAHEVSSIDDDSRGLELCNYKTKSLSKSARSISSTLMKPTASNLAKQRNPTEVPTTRIFRRSPSHNSSPTDGKETKRQKLEAGYSRKTANLKHQAAFTHKTDKKVDLTDVKLASKPKVTIPRQFDLETAHRAQRHNKSRTNTESDGHIKSSSHMFKARPLNKKILEAPSSPFRKKSTPQLTEFHEFHLKTSERALLHTFSNVGRNSNCTSISNIETKEFKRSNSTDASRQERCRLVNKIRGSPDDKSLTSKGERGVFRNIKQENVMERKFTNDRRNEAPTELFSKLSLASEVKQTTKSQSKEQPTSKGLKENRPQYFHLEHERMNSVKEEMQRPCGKQYQCMNVPDINNAFMLAGACTFV